MRTAGPGRTLGVMVGLGFLAMVLFAASCGPISVVRVEKQTVLVTRIVRETVLVSVPAEKPEEKPQEKMDTDRVLTSLAEWAERGGRIPEAEWTPPSRVRTALARGESGSAVGIVLWNDAPIQGVKVKLCQQWIQFMVGGDCRGEQVQRHHRYSGET